MNSSQSRIAAVTMGIAFFGCGVPANDNATPTTSSNGVSAADDGRSAVNIDDAAFDAGHGDDTIINNLRSFHLASAADAPADVSRSLGTVLEAPPLTSLDVEDGGVILDDASAENPSQFPEQGVEVPLTKDELRLRNTSDASAEPGPMEVPAAIGFTETAQFSLRAKDKIARLPAKGVCPIEKPDEVLKTLTPYRYVQIENRHSFGTKVSVWASSADTASTLASPKRGVKTRAILAVYRGSEKPKTKQEQAACVGLNALCDTGPCTQPAEWPGLVDDNGIDIAPGESITVYIGASLATSKGDFTLNVRTDQIRP